MPRPTCGVAARTRQQAARSRHDPGAHGLPKRGRIAYTATTPGGQGALYVDVTYDVVDKNGNVVKSESHSARLAGAVATMQQELFTFCASAL